MGNAEQVPVMTKTSHTIIDLTSPHKCTGQRSQWSSTSDSDETSRQSEQDAEHHACDATSSVEREDDGDSFYEEMLQSTEEFDEDERLTGNGCCWIT